MPQAGIHFDTFAKLWRQRKKVCGTNFYVTVVLSSAVQDARRKKFSGRCIFAPHGFAAIFEKFKGRLQASNWWAKAIDALRHD